VCRYQHCAEYIVVLRVALDAVRLAAPAGRRRGRLDVRMADVAGGEIAATALSTGAEAEPLEAVVDACERDGSAGSAQLLGARQALELGLRLGLRLGLGRRDRCRSGYLCSRK
jgi:hypothetical protein